MRIHFTVNGQQQTVDAAPTETLVHILRERLGLLGTKEGCGRGDCGACSVWMNGRLVNSCLVWAGKVDGAEIHTIEGLAAPEALHPIQQCFLDAGAVQCGYCTPGMVMAAYDLLRRNRTPTREEIREAIAGNLCRCTGYSAIVDAVEMAAAYFRAHGEVTP